MLVDQDFKRLYYELKKKSLVDFTFHGIAISARLYDDGQKVHLFTHVYQGGNYIPNSVRKSLKENVPFDSHEIKTFLNIDETAFSIYLNFVDIADLKLEMNFKSIIDAFSILADEWREYLDKHDKSDLVHVRVK